jgi:carboxymethylenebutenolidase
VDELQLGTPSGAIRTFLAVPEGAGPWPGVVVLHDAGGLGLDTAQQAQWLAGEGFLAVAPDLFHDGNPVRCMISLAREINRRSGASFDDIEAARRLLATREDCTGRVGVIGFCMGGGFALLMALGRGFDASSVNYSTVSLGSITDEDLASACPIVASYGAKDRGNRNSAAKLSALLERHQIAHDVKEYPSAGHGFMNDHEGAGDRIPPVFRFLSWASGTRFDAEATTDARARIVEFFGQHLREPATGPDR